MRIPNKLSDNSAAAENYLHREILAAERLLSVEGKGDERDWLPSVTPGLFTGVQHDHVASAKCTVLEKLSIEGRRKVADEVRDKGFTGNQQKHVILAIM